MLGVFLLQTPTQAQIVEYCEELRRFVLLYCPWVAVHNLHFTELAVFLQAKIERRFAREPSARSQLSTLVPLDTSDALQRVRVFNYSIDNETFCLMMKSFVIMFREHGINFIYFVMIGKRFTH
jgi:hypothetical protein